MNIICYYNQYLRYFDIFINTNKTIIIIILHNTYFQIDLIFGHVLFVTKLRN